MWIRCLMMSIFSCCSFTLFGAGNLEVLDQKNFEEKVGSGKVLVDFYADWCGPCKRLTPVLESIAKEGKVMIYKVNIDKSSSLADQYEVKGVPTMVLLKNGKEKGRLVGFRDKSTVRAFVDQ